MSASTIAPARPLTARAEGSAPPAPSAPVRMPLWDNARLVAVAFVIAGHAILKLISASDSAYAVYLFIYAFHLPALVVISGRFASSRLPGVRDVKKLVATLVVPYLIFETIWSLIHWGVSGTLTLDYTSAWWTLWFLISLVFWRVLLPYLLVLRFPLTISLLISVGSGYLATVDDRLSLARTLGLLPFFVFGWKLKQWRLGERWLALRPAVVRRVRAAALALFVALGVTCALGIDTWRELLLRRFLLYDEAYSTFGYDQWWAGALRLGFIGLAMLLCLALVVLMPRGTTFLTAFGQATLYIYLLHSFVLYPIRQWSWFDGNTAPWVLVAALALSFALPFALGNPVVRRVVHPIVEPRMSWLFRREQVPSGG